MSSLPDLGEFFLGSVSGECESKGLFVFMGSTLHLMQNGAQHSAIVSARFTLMQLSFSCLSPTQHMMVHMMALTILFFITCFTPCPTFSLNMYRPTVYNHMDAIIMCWDQDPDPPYIRSQSNVFALNDIIT